jgi:thiol:disulfide interchange protein DsbD
MMRPAVTAALGCSLLACLAPAGARGVGAQEHPIQFLIRSPRATPRVRTGDTLAIVVHSTIPTGWHLYSMTQPPGGPIATTIDVGPSPLALLDLAVRSPLPTIAADPNFGIQSEWYQDSVSFQVPARIAAFAPQGSGRIDLRIGYQTCNDRYCLPPTEDTVHLSVVVAGAGDVAGRTTARIETPATDSAPTFRRPGIASASPGATPSSVAIPIESTSGARSFALFLWLAMTMGAFSLLTPCVYPMVPITISYFTRSDRGTRVAAVRDAVMYAGGIVVAFTGLGVGLSVAMGVAGLSRFAANPVLNLAVGALFIAFALSLFGVLHLALPQRFVNSLAAASGGTRFGRVATSLLMGVTFAVTTFTCTAPFVGTLLVSATQGDWRWPVAGLLAFSSVFALPFLVLALVPHSLSRLPRSGEWMVTMKGTLGFIELAAALKFLSNADLVEGWGVFTRQTVVALWAILGAVLAAYLFGVRFQRPWLRRSARWHPVAATATLAATVFLATGFGGGRLGELEAFLPPAGRAATGVASAGELSWILDDLDGGLRSAGAQNKLVLIDFTGYTCTNCRWMEANMFPRPDVERELSRFVRVRLFTDGRGEVDRRQQLFERDHFRTVALPLYAVVDSAGAPRATFLGMTRDSREFIQFLTNARAGQ